MKRILVVGCLMAVTFIGRSQNVFDPNDPIIRYDSLQPLGSATNPDPNIPGMQKWVSVPTIGVSLGVDTFDNRSFKQYFINHKGAWMAFRLKFPRSYLNPDSAGKTYPVNLFLHGGGEVGCPTNGGIYNNERPLWLGGKHFMELVDKNKFDGFLLFPQYVVSEGCFAGWATAADRYFEAILAIVDSMARYARADIDRLVVDGLSGGGYGAWRMADRWPKRIAKILPSAAAGAVGNREAFVHIPIWFATGGKDLDPSPAQAQYALQKMKELGADIRYTLYPERGHAVWYQHWREPDFAAELNNVHKANPLVFFQRSEFCLPTEVNARLGITAGFYAYEWQKDEVTIASSVNNVQSVIDNSSIITFTGNEITVNAYGTYRVRFQRTATSGWSGWSMRPAVIKTKTTTITAPIEIDGMRSKVLPAVDGSTSVPLILPEGYINYEWYRVSDNTVVATTRNFEATPGVYKARYAEEYGCSTEFSPNFTVVNANGSPKPDAASSLTAEPLSRQSIRLSWSQGNNETGFEIYRRDSAVNSFVFIGRAPANAVTYTDTALSENAMYYYTVRAVNETGAALTSNVTTVATLVDVQPPTAPHGLQYTQSSSPGAIHLVWNVSADDQVVDRYDIYVNGVKLYSSLLPEHTVSGLDSLTPYNISVRAVDVSGNASAPSNQVTFIPDNTPPGTIPGMPSPFAAVTSGYNKINLSWTDASSNETGFEIVRSLTLNGTYLPVATVAANTTNFTDSGLAAQTRYYYRIRAIGSYGESAFSPKVNAATSATPAVPVAPGSLKALEAATGGISLSWKDNSANETSFQVYRSEDNDSFSLISSLPANSNAYTDTVVNGFTVYYYYVNGINASGPGEHSDTVQLRAGNNAPEINIQSSLVVKWGVSQNLPFTVTDDPGDSVTVVIASKPSFVQAGKVGDDSYVLIITPGAEHAGTYTLNITATDNNGKSTSAELTLTVGDKNTKSVYLNFGASGKSGLSPWNNWLGKRNSGDVINDLRDENNNVTNISMTMVNGWSGVSGMGHISGNNSGILPDAVLESGLSDSSSSRQIRISGLNPSMQYNLVLVGSYNEGMSASATWTVNGQASVLDSRYNTNRSANLSNLLPNANGELVITAARATGSPIQYLNGLVIEEYDQSISMLNPDNLYAEVVNKTAVRLTWSDRTNNERAIQGYELLRATDSAFSKGVINIFLPGNTTTYLDEGAAANTQYWYKLRSLNDTTASEFSRRVWVTTPASIVYVNFNTTVANAPAPWNNLMSPPLSSFTTEVLKDDSGKPTTMFLTLEKEFNGEFTSGMNTENNSGIVPDRVLMANYWLDKSQLSQFRLSGLNHTRRYSVGFIGSSGPQNWFKGNYTATYTVNGRTVYLNSWLNTSKVVFINDVVPDPDGKVLLDFSTTTAAGYGFNSGIIIYEYAYTPDSLPVSPPPVDTIPDQPVDTIPDNPNPPTDTIPDTPNPPTDTIPDTPDPTDTLPNIPDPPVDSIPVTEDPLTDVVVYPNPFLNRITFRFNNGSGNKAIMVELYDPQGRRLSRKEYGLLPAGNTTLEFTSFESNLRAGVYFAVLKVDGEIARTMKIVKNRN